MENHIIRRKVFAAITKKTGCNFYHRFQNVTVSFFRACCCLLSVFVRIFVYSLHVKVSL